MPNLKEIRTRINSIKTTRQVTSAMKMVSAAKLKKSQDLIMRITPYADELQQIMNALSVSRVNQIDSVFSTTRPLQRVLLVIIASNRGLCGSFNAKAVERAVELAYEKYPNFLSEGKLSCLIVGRQTEKLIRHTPLPIYQTRHELLHDLHYETSASLAEEIMQEFKNGQFDRVEIIHNQFVNVAVQEPVCSQFLPIEIPKADRSLQPVTDYIYEPSREYILREMIPRSLKMQFFRMVLDSVVAEHSARMTSMHQATDNATELIHELTLTFNKARQAAITNAIMEVTNGAEALKG